MVPKMDKVLFYVPTEDDTPLSLKLFDVIERVGVQKQSEIYRTIDELSCRLRCPEGRPRLGVILTPSRQDLLEVLSIRELLHNLRILLILPDNEFDTVTQGHILRPRFLTDIEGNFSDLAEVLRKIRKGH